MTLSHRYLGIVPPAESDEQTRLIVRVTAQNGTTFSG
jgi:hypothetical protein